MYGAGLKFAEGLSACQLLLASTVMHQAYHTRPLQNLMTTRATRPHLEANTQIEVLVVKVEMVLVVSEPYFPITSCILIIR